MDDLYPNDSGAMFQDQPEERTEEEQKEAGMVKASAPIIPEILAHFDERIAFYGSVDSIDINLNDDPLTHQKKTAVAQMMKSQLEQERSELESLFEQYL